MSKRRRGRITVQHQPTGAARMMQRMMGLVHAVFGSVFVILSITVIIPNAGLFGVVFLVAGAFFAINGIRIMVSKNGLAQRVAYDVEQDLERSIAGLMEEPPTSASNSSERTAEERLQELKKLYEQDLITDAEYQEKRQEILNEL